MPSGIRGSRSKRLTTVRAGVFNAYGTVILRVPLSYERFNLRTTANLGMSRLLIDLYGAPKGSTGHLRWA